MRKILILFIVLFLPMIANAEEITYSNAQNYIKEVMASYYFKGPAFQYNYSKSTFGLEVPEDATSQDIKYMVCSAFVYDVHAEAFGMYYKSTSKFPRYNDESLTIVKDYYLQNKNSKINGNYLVYYQNNTENIKYADGLATGVNDKIKFQDFVELIRPGDIFAFTGHSLIAYDVVTKSDGTKDVLILNSNRKGRIRTPIEGSTTTIDYDFNYQKIHPNILDTPVEGTVKAEWLSEITYFTNNNGDEKLINCSENECFVLRTFYNDNGKAKFNYDITEKNIKKSQLRAKYSGLTIEKTSDKGDNNVIHLGEELTYTIKITNNSNINKNNVTYSEFHLEESIDNKVLYISSNYNALYKNGVIKWDIPINTLKPGENIELKYTVKIINDDNNVGSIISSNGKLYDNNIDNNITTGTVEHKIVNRINVLKMSYNTCYERFKNQASNLEFIDAIIKCATGLETNISNFKFEDIIIKKSFPKARTEKDAVALKEESETNKIYLEMILNNYWNGLVVYNISNNNILDLPRWGGDSASLRNKTINSNDFQNGDVLIYQETENGQTKENGIYAYIYINGKFMGINGSNDTIRNEFTYKYYTDMYSERALENKFYRGYSTVKDNSKILEYINYQTLFGKKNYVIFRPSLIIKPNKSISNSPIFFYLILFLLALIAFILIIKLLLIRKVRKDKIYYENFYKM